MYSNRRRRRDLFHVFPHHSSINTDGIDSGNYWGFVNYFNWFSDFMNEPEGDRNSDIPPPNTPVHQMDFNELDAIDQEQGADLLNNAFNAFNPWGGGGQQP